MHTRVHTPKKVNRSKRLNQNIYTLNTLEFITLRFALQDKCRATVGKMLALIKWKTKANLNSKFKSIGPSVNIDSLEIHYRSEQSLNKQLIGFIFRFTINSPQLIEFESYQNESVYRFIT